MILKFINRLNVDANVDVFMFLVCVRVDLCADFYVTDLTKTCISSCM